MPQVLVNIVILLPDYPDQVILAHRLRIERLALFGTLLLIASGAWWLLPAVNGETELLPRLGPVVAIFASSLLLVDLIEYGPVQKTRIGTAANVAWPSVIVFAADIFARDLDSIIAMMTLVIIAGILWFVTHRLLSGTLAVRRYRGLTSIAGLAFAIALMVSMGIGREVFIAVILAVLATMIPDLTKKDEDHAARKEFGAALDAAESKLLQLRGDGISLEQASSILKTAREECWTDPARGMKMVDEALRDAERIQAIARDLDDIRAESLSAVERSEAIAAQAEGPRKSFDLGDREAQHGALREAELLYRRAKNRAMIIEEYWQDAVDAIATAESAIESSGGSKSENVKSILNQAKEALFAEQPKEAIHIASSIAGHLESLESITIEAKSAIEDAQNAIEAAGEDIPIHTRGRLDEAKRAMEAGDSALAKGLADSIVRDVKETSGAMQEVQRGLRQRKQLQERFPKGAAGEIWKARLEEVASSADSEKWNSAASDLRSLTHDLQAWEVQMNEARELHEFLTEEWKILRGRLDSNNVKASDEMRQLAESAVAQANEALESGEVNQCLSALGRADELIENLRRRV